MLTSRSKLFAFIVASFLLSLTVTASQVEAGTAPVKFAAVSGVSSVVFGWAKDIGGDDSEYSHAIAFDASGNIYTTGYFYRTADFDPGPGEYNLTSAGNNDIFVSKLDRDGNFIWARGLGGTDYDYSEGMAVDENGNVYVTGYFKGIADFDPGAGIYNLYSDGDADIFVFKLDSGGNFVWAKRMGGNGDDEGAAIALDGNGNVYTTGFFYDTADFDPGSGVYNLTSAGGADIFISKFVVGGGFVWAKRIGGTDSDYGHAIAVDGNGNVYTTGIFYGTADFNPGASTYNLTSYGSADIFLSKLNTDGVFILGKRVGGADYDRSDDIAMDSNGNVYTAGYFYGTADFDPGASACELTSAGIADIFISKYDEDINFLWAKRMGGVYDDVSKSIAVDGNGNVYTTGHFNGTADFDPGSNTYYLTSAGETDIFYSRLDNNGNFVWGNRVGGTNYDYGSALAVEKYGNLFTTGSFIGSVDFDPGAGTYNLTSAGGRDIFISKLVNQTRSTFKSLGVQDGWILESAETSNTGGALDSAATTLYAGDDAQKRQYRSILSFSTKTLPDNAVITKVTLKVKKQGIVGGGNPVSLFQGFLVDIKKGTFGSSARLQGNDFQAQANKSYGPFKPALKNGWYSFNLTPARAYINKLATNGGVTQVRLRFKLDDNNNGIANYLSLYSGNAAWASRPELVIEYYVP